MRLPEKLLLSTLINKFCLLSVFITLAVQLPVPCASALCTRWMILNILKFVEYVMNYHDAVFLHINFIYFKSCSS